MRRNFAILSWGGVLLTFEVVMGKECRTMVVFVIDMGGNSRDIYTNTQ